MVLETVRKRVVDRVRTLAHGRARAGTARAGGMIAAAPRSRPARVHDPARGRMPAACPPVRPDRPDAAAAPRPRVARSSAAGPSGPRPRAPCRLLRRHRASPAAARRQRIAERLGLAAPRDPDRPGAASSPIDLDLTVAYGLPIAEVARQVDSAVRYALRRALGREVDRLTIHVDGLRTGRLRGAARRPPTPAVRRPRAVGPATSPPAGRTSPDGPPATATAPGFLAAFRSAVASLEAHVDEINALNVFPVPDGDTGTNMLATVRAALEEAEAVGRDAPAERIAAAVSFGALMGARGNSGVITSQILRGHRRGPRRQEAVQRPRPRERARPSARRPPTGRSRKPVEGTILTVIREASAAAVAAAERDNDDRGGPRRDRRRRPSSPSRGRRRCCRSCARRASSTPAARACSGCSRARSLQRPAAGRSTRRGAPAAGSARRGPPRGRAGVPGRRRRARGGRVRLRDGLHPDRAPRRRRSTSRRSRRTSSRSASSVLVGGDARMVKVHVHNERPGRGHRLRPVARDADPDHGREPRQPGRRRPRGAGRGVRRRGEPAPTVGARRPRERDRGGGEPPSGPDAHVGVDDLPAPTPMARTAGRRESTRPRAGGRGRRRRRRARRGLPRARRRPRSSAAARRPTRAPASCSRSPASRRAASCCSCPNNPNVLLAAEQVAPICDGPPPRRRPDAQRGRGLRGPARARPGRGRGGQRRADDRRRPRPPDDPGHRGGARRDDRRRRRSRRARRSPSTRTTASSRSTTTATGGARGARAASSRASSSSRSTTARTRRSPRPRRSRSGSASELGAERRRGRPRRPAALPLPDRGRVGEWRSAGDGPPPRRSRPRGAEGAAVAAAAHRPGRAPRHAARRVGPRGRERPPAGRAGGSAS